MHTNVNEKIIAQINSTLIYFPPTLPTQILYIDKDNNGQYLPTSIRIFD